MTVDVFDPKARDDRAAGLFAWVLTAVGVVSLLVGGIWDALQAGGDGNWFDAFALLTTFASFPILGSILVQRSARNPLGWILIGIGLFGGITITAMTYAREGLTGAHGLPGSTFAAWLATWTWYPTVQLIFPFLLMYFPTGRLPSRKWRPLLWVSLVLLVTITVLPMFQARLEDESFYNVDNPIGIAVIEDVELLLNPLFIALSFVAILAVVSLIVRYRTSRTIERMQLKWFILAAAIVVVSLFLEELFGFTEFAFSVGVLGLPVAIGIAVLRYRLYEIDVLINRALVYGLLTGLAVLGYLGLVVALRFVLEPITPESDLAVAASTLAVAAAIRPLRTRIQSFIDRRFYRRKYNSTRSLSAFSTRLRDEVDVAVVESDVIDVLHDTVQPMHAGVWLRNASVRAR
jgi:hypothetical protein